MAYIVDGNNVMGQMRGWQIDKSQTRRDLLQQLAAFARVKKARVTAVFDGSPDANFPEASAFRGVKILYAERGSDADARIVKLVESSKDRRGLTIVTSDRSLAFKVRARGANIVRSEEFRQQLETAMRAKPKSEDGEHFEIDDMNQWFRYFGVVPEDDDA
jgi:predicted RNA-binding protein with PIN domain